MTAASMLIHGDAPIAAAELPEGVRTMLASIVNASEDAIISVSRDLKIISWNNAATKTYGFSEEQALGSGLELFVPPEQLDRSVNSCRAVLNGVPTVSFEQPFPAQGCFRKRARRGGNRPRHHCAQGNRTRAGRHARSGARCFTRQIGI